MKNQVSIERLLTHCQIQKGVAGNNDDIYVRSTTALSSHDAPRRAQVGVAEEIDDVEEGPDGRVVLVAGAVALPKRDPGVVQGQTVTVDSTVMVTVAMESEKRPVAKRAAR